MPLVLGAVFFILRVSPTGSFPKPLSPEEEARCIKACREGNLEARNKLIEHNLRLVAHIVKKYYAASDEQDDLISIGTIGLIKGVSTFDPDKNVRLATYASRCIEKAILTYTYKSKQTFFPHRHFCIQAPFITRSEAKRMQLGSNHIAIYSRKSKFTGRGESIGNQVELCRDYIRTHFGAIYADQALIYEDEGFSGGDLHRPAFRRMMQAAGSHSIKAIVVYRLDRISRSISDFSSLIEELTRFNIAFISIREQFDTQTPIGRAMMYIASVFSQLERETIAERIRDNMHELAKTGRWLGGITPIGFVSEHIKTVSIDGKSRCSCQLKLIPEESERVRQIYALFLSTRSLTATEAELNRQEVYTKNGRPFTRYSIRSILQNPVYLTADHAAYSYFSQKQAEVCSDLSAFDGTHGVLAYHRTKQCKGKPTVTLPVSEWIIAVGGHAAVISSDVWLAAQSILEHNRSAHKKCAFSPALSQLSIDKTTFSGYS